VPFLKDNKFHVSEVSRTVNWWWGMKTSYVNNNGRGNRGNQDVYLYNAQSLQIKSNGTQLEL
jgi:hypothetical protein